MKRIISLLIILAMLSALTGYASEGVSLTVTETKYDISKYTQNEIFVMYKDNTSEIITFSDEDEFNAKTTVLTGNENVLLFQPNYSYTSAALSVSDEYISQQWALYNDGSFKMEEQKNQFPVFDMPFGDVIMPGMWHAPDNFGRPGGNFRRYESYYTGSQVTAMAEIDINIEDAWNIYNDSGKEVIVALVDTGIDYTHEDLNGRIWVNTDEIPSNGIDEDGNGFVDDVYGWNFYNNNNRVYTGNEDDHGTHGAGTVVAKANNGIGIAGITGSNNIKVMSVKALGGNEGSGSTASVIRAIQYAEANGAQICNLSLGASYNDNALYQTIANSNMLFVVAAGNDGTNSDSSPCYPASYSLDNIISVANLSYDGTLDYSSNYGENSVDIAAPGSYILSTTSGGGYSYMSGTSMAAPMVTGAAALIYSHFGDSIAVSDIKEIILSSATPLESLKDAVKTGGMLNLGDALSYSTENLSDTEWETKKPHEYVGSAPEISAHISNRRSQSYLVVSIYDEDNDIAYASYALGDHTADYFVAGEDVEIKLDKNGTAAFQPKEGIYTFYAVDSFGNETTHTVTLTRAENNRTRQPQTSYRSVFDYLFSDIGFERFFR